MSQENVEVVKEAVTAVNERDLDAYLDCCTEDIELQVKPMATLGGVYTGRNQIQRFWTDIADTTPDFRIEIESLQPVADDRVLGFMCVNATGRASGLVVMDNVRTANVYSFRHGKISRVEIFTDRRDALEALGLSEQDAHAEPR